jgi:hypothetical protein
MTGQLPVISTQQVAKQANWRCVKHSGNFRWINPVRAGQLTSRVRDIGGKLPASRSRMFTEQLA